MSIWLVSVVAMQQAFFWGGKASYLFTVLYMLSMLLMYVDGMANQANPIRWIEIQLQFQVKTYVVFPAGEYKAILHLVVVTPVDVTSVQQLIVSAQELHLIKLPSLDWLWYYCGMYKTGGNKIDSLITSVGK